MTPDVTRQPHASDSFTPEQSLAEQWLLDAGNQLTYQHNGGEIDPNEYRAKSVEIDHLIRGVQLGEDADVISRLADMEKNRREEIATEDAEARAAGKTLYEGDGDPIGDDVHEYLGYVGLH